MNTYVGRFAPTPSGRLHFGSLVAALGSYLDARAHQGRWLLRIEDVDPPRVVAGVADAILRTLASYGFDWDGAIVLQSRRAAAYEAALRQLVDAGQVYGCTCSRKEIAGHAHTGVDGPIYPGDCRGRPPIDSTALRFQVPSGRVNFRDRLLGEVGCDVNRECGDFVLRRADAVFTYQLAAVVDDAEAGVTDVVRGADLLASTPRQIVLQQALGLSTPRYLHLPVVLDANGDKLSKQTLAAPLDDARPLPALKLAARFLGLGEIAAETLDAFWRAAVGRWDVKRLPSVTGRQLMETDED